MKKVFRKLVFYCLCLVLLTVFGTKTVMGANITVDVNGLTSVSAIQTAIQTGINTIDVGETVTVINSGIAFNPTARLQMNIPANKTVNWNFEYSTPSNFGNPLLTISGDGAFVIASGGSLIRTGSGETLRSEGEYTPITVHGIVSSNTARAIHVLGGNSTVTIDNGTVSSASTTPLQAAIYTENVLNTGLNVIVKGDGKVLANSDGGYAIMTYGSVEINDNALVSARNGGVAIDALGTQSTVTVNGGTVSTTGGSSTDAVGGSAISCHYKVVVNGGTVSATTGKAVHTTDPNASVIINGGTVHATTGYAIRTDYNTTSTIEIAGGFVFAYGNNISGVINNTSYTLPLGSDGVVVAWNNSADTYLAFTTTNLSINPAGTATWRNDGTNGGIKYTNGSNTGFFPINGVTVNPDTDYGLIFDANNGKLYLDVVGDGSINPLYEYIDGQGTTWTGSTGLLDLTDFSWTTPAPVALRIAGSSMTINMSGDNSFISMPTTTLSTSTGIMANPSVSLVTITGNGALNAKAGTANSVSSGISIDELKVESGTVNATAGATGSGDSYAVHTSNTVINGGTLIATATSGTGSNYGINAGGVLTINKGMMEIISAGSAFNKQPSLPDAYTWWMNTTTTPPATGTLYYPGSSATNYSYNSSDKYVKIESAQAAVVSNITVSGTVGVALAAGQTATIKIYGNEVAAALTDENALDWFPNLPNGVTVRANATIANPEIIELTFDGIPILISSDVFDITIPAGILTGGSSLAVQPNPDAKFDIIIIDIPTASVNETNITFTTSVYGYDNSEIAQQFTITNTGSGQITGLKVEFGNDANSAFEISAALSATTLSSGNTTSIDIRPKTRLSVNASPHSDLLIIRWDNDDGVGLVVNLNFTVTPKEITVTALGGSSIYGESPINPGLTATGLAYGETASVLTGLYNNFYITSKTHADPYLLTVTGTLINENYTVIERYHGLWRVYKAAGADLSEAPTIIDSPTQNILKVNAISIPVNPGNQRVEYAIATSNKIPGSDLYKLAWQSDTIFTGDFPEGITYYIYARSAENENYNAGKALISAATTILFSGVENISQEKPVIAWIQNSRLHVSGLTKGKPWNVFSLSGVLVYQSVADNDKADISLSAHGVYIVQSEKSVVKVAY